MPTLFDEPTAHPKPDTIGAALIAHNLVPNEFLLDLNGGLNAGGTERGYPWNLPSRLFQFPIEVTKQGEDGMRKSVCCTLCLLITPIHRREASTS